MLIILMFFRHEYLKIFINATIFSSLGGLFGYFIGSLFTENAIMIMEFYGYQEQVMQLKNQLISGGSAFSLWIGTLFLAGFTPLPFKIFTITSGIINFNIFIFFVICIISRGLRFFIVAYFSVRFGKPFVSFLEKKGNLWFEKFVSLNKKTTSFLEKKINMKNYEKKIDFKISKNQNFIEYSELGINYLKQISKIIKARSGGILIIDYGYNEDKMKNTLQALYKHEYSDVLAKIGNSDITHNINFRLFEKIIKKLGGLKHSLTTQKEFLTKMGIYERAEMIAKNQNFLKKADIYYRLKRLTDDKQMGKLFKVMLIKNQKNNFNLGF